MGLDMYLRGSKMVTMFDNPEGRPKEDGFEINKIELELGYWRKHPNLHGFIVQTFAGGEDECQEIELTSERIDQVIAAVKARELPTPTGFFFGASDGSDEEIANDVAIFEKAKAWLIAEDDKSWRSVYYRASW